MRSLKYFHMPRLKILFIINTLAIGGSENQVVLTARALSKRFKVAILYLYDTPPSHALNSRGLDVVLLKKTKTPKKYFGNIIRYIKKFSPAIVHNVVFPSDRIGVILSAISKDSIIISHRATSETTPEKRHSLELTKLTNKLCDALITCTDSVKKTTLKLEKADPGKVVTIYNGVDVGNIFKLSRRSSLDRERALRGTPYEPIIGVASNLTMGKGHVYFLDAAKYILERMPTAKFVIIGDGYLKDYLQRFAARSGILDNVKFLGHRHDMPNLLGSLDISVFPSTLKEGCPNVILESMAACRPVVATSVGGVP